MQQINKTKSKLKQFNYWHKTAESCDVDKGIGRKIFRGGGGNEKNKTEK